MNPMYCDYALLRHHELIAESLQRRRRASARRVIRAGRLRRRADGLNRRATALVESTHR